MIGRRASIESARLLLSTSRAEIMGALAVTVVVYALAIVFVATMGPCASRGECSLLASGDVHRGYVAPLSIGLMLALALIGTLLGASVAATDIERGTSVLAWSLMPRRRWLAARMVPPFVLALVLAALLTVLMGAVAEIRHPGEVLAEDYGMVGVLPVARLVLVFAIGALVGTAIGQSLAAIIVTLVLTAICFAFLVVAWPYGTPAEAFAGDIAPPGSRAVAQRYSSIDGRVMTLDEATTEAPAWLDEEGKRTWIDERLDLVTLAVTPDQLGEVVLRETAGLLALSAVLSVGTVIVLDRRRPTA